MTHGDDDGIIIPPKVAPSQVVLLPIFRKPKDRAKVMEFTEGLSRELKSLRYGSGKLKVEIDDRDTGGARGMGTGLKRVSRCVSKSARETLRTTRSMSDVETGDTKRESRSNAIVLSERLPAC